MDHAEPATGDFRADRARARAWSRWVFAPGQHLQPGEHLLVRDEFTLEKPLSTVTWSQRVPPNCHALQTGAQAQGALGEPKTRHLGALLWSMPTLPARLQAQEYEIVAVRPGVCLLPLPEVAAGGQALTVTAEPAEILLHVDGS